MASRKEKQIQLPTQLLNKFNGFSLDFGGSVIKVAYLSKEDWNKGSSKGAKENFGIVRLISFSREEIDKCLEFLKENCFMRRECEGDKPVMYTCGIGGYQYGKKIEDFLNVRTCNENELDGFKACIQYYVNNYSPREFCVNPKPEITEAVLESQKKQHHQFLELSESMDPDNQFKAVALEILNREYNPYANLRPYILAIYGSAWGSLRCDTDNMFSRCGIAVFGGRSFLGLGSLLIGAESYDELMSLAEQGDSMTLDVTLKDVMMEGKAGVDKKQGDDDIYGKVLTTEMAPKPVFLWGKAVGKKLGDFKREDLARTLLNTMCNQLARTALQTLHVTRTKHMFMAGSFISHPLAQRLVTEEFENQRWHCAATLPGIDGDYHLHILEFGSHFGAIGSFINGPVRAERRKLEEDQKRKIEGSTGVHT